MRGPGKRVVAVVVAVLAFAACSGDDSAVTGDEPAPAVTADGGGALVGSAVTLTMVGLAFEPSDVAVPQGGTLTIRNQDTVAHTFTMDEGSIDVSLEPAQQMEVTPDAGGGFHCEIHPSMTGTLAIG
jgi:plastocyanin